MSGTVLGGFVDSLIQSFENCRSGLTDEQLRAGDGGAQAFFVDRYEKELPRLRDTVRLQEPLLSRDQSDALFKELDELIRKVVVPAYGRLALRHSVRERAGFYFVGESLRLVERLGWAFLGVLVGLFVIWAPFIPLWSKEWVLPFMLAGLLFPDLRRYLAVRAYENELNKLVSRTDQEIDRLNGAYLLASEEAKALGHDPAATAAQALEQHKESV